jgi:hypothetical protein
MRLAGQQAGDHMMSGAEQLLSDLAILLRYLEQHRYNQDCFYVEKGIEKLIFKIMDQRGRETND